MWYICMVRALLIGVAVCASCVLAPAAASATTVYAATSLRAVFPLIDDGPRFSFGGSNVLQMQIERGAPADVFASAGRAEPRALHRGGRCGRPATFATNVLVLVVPKGDPAGIRSVEDLARGPRRRVAVGTPGVPVGDYTRRLLAKMRMSRVLARNAVSNEPNVGAVVAKVALGAAAAGFVYATDAKAAARRVRTIELPARAQPPIRYDFCIVLRRGGDRAGAQRFVNEVRTPRARRLLAEAGFGLPHR